jgi:hypothetical protein
MMIMSKRDYQIERCEAEAERFQMGCGQRPTFNQVLCQSPEIPGMSHARFAAMVRSVAIYATTIDDTNYGQIMRED